MNKKTGFTLAEVLITLTIIGVIAAITIPNLMQKYQEHATVNKVKKFYSTLTNAYTQAVKENGTPDEWNIVGENAQNAAKIYEMLIKPYFKVVKTCGASNGTCAGSVYKQRKGTREFPKFSTQQYFYSLSLADGSSVIIRPHPADYTSWGYYSVFYDTNGSKGPNIWSVDMFAFYACTNTKLDFYGGIAQTLLSKCLTGDEAEQCTSWVVRKGNMDYLHCSDLSWTGKDKCGK